MKTKKKTMDGTLRCGWEWERLEDVTLKEPADKDFRSSTRRRLANCPLFQSKIVPARRKTMPREIR